MPSSTSLMPRRWPASAVAELAARRDPLARFLRVKARTLASRARQLVALTPEAVGLRPEDMPYAPRPEHFAAANKRLQAIDHAVRGRLAELTRAISNDCYDAIRRASPKTFAG